MEYINIAVCSNNKNICEELKTLLNTVLNSYSISIYFNIKLFYEGKELCESMHSEEYDLFDLIFLDIDMPDKNGIETGKYIRDELKNEITQIVFMSIKDVPATSLSGLRPINFFVKPIEKAQIENVINKFSVITEHIAKKFNYKKGHTVNFVYLNDILFFENKTRKIVIHTKDTTDDFYGSIEDIYKELKSFGFLNIHKSFIINYQHIKTLTLEYVIMDDDTTIPISRNKRDEIRDFYNKLCKSYILTENTFSL